MLRAGDLVIWPAIGQTSGRAHVKGRAIWRATVSAGDAVRANGRAVDPMASDWAGVPAGGRAMRRGVRFCPILPDFCPNCRGCGIFGDFGRFFAKV